MLLRFFVLCGCAFAFAGCHTIDAVHRIARPSPVTSVSVEPSQDRVTWLAEYREPPGGLDPILHRIFVRGVTKRGHLDVDPDSTCVVSVEGDETSAEPLRDRESLLVYRLHVPVRDAFRPPASPSCEYQLRLRLSPGAARYPEAKAILVQNQSAEPRFEATFPTERPALDPKRWGWLIVAPALDAATIAVGIPYLGIVSVIEGFFVGLLGGSGLLQPTEIGLPVLVLTTTSGNTSNDRVLGLMEDNGQIFVSANHWPRGWYHRALANPNVQVSLEGEKADYLAVPATEEERDRINADHPMPTVARFLFGFPPRGILRLDPR